MAVQLFSHEISDLCLGKPPLRPLSITAKISDALSFFRRSSGDTSLTVWSSSSLSGEASKCVGKISVVDVLCFLCREDNISSPFLALSSPVSVLLPPEGSTIVKLLDPSSSILDAVDSILEGAQGLIVPRRSRNSSSTKQKPQKPPVGRQYCWITQEDVIRFFFNSINHFSPVPFNSLQSLNIIEEKILSVHYNDPALSALAEICNSPSGQTAVAVVDDQGRLVGEISLYTLACCDETVAPAVATLSAGDLMAYIDYGGPPEDLVQLVKTRLEERKLDQMLELLEDDHSTSSTSSCLSSSPSSSSDDEVTVKRSRTNSGRFTSGTEPIVCHPRSSLIATMIQALSHRYNHVWVVEEDYSLIGIVTFVGMLKVFRDRVPCFS
ncbi:CBS domain-containing protein CBSX5-like [Amaranthus tricolor]|uniref:CBS domain-containing protein CBSX5-like n=1 Tax=Amaranthus tricolor TaxID=29722 RepID=UPI0025858735|nr:CBS domain-containing protein CBSX5-like [Amaranthus tricolor]